MKTIIFSMLILCLFSCIVENTDCEKSVNSTNFFEVISADSSSLNVQAGDTISIEKIDSSTYVIQAGDLTKEFRYIGKSKVEGKEGYDLFLGEFFPVAAIHAKCENDTTDFEIIIQNGTQAGGEFLYYVTGNATVSITSNGGNTFTLVINTSYPASFELSSDAKGVATCWDVNGFGYKCEVSADTGNTEINIDFETASNVNHDISFHIAYNQ